MVLIVGEIRHASGSTSIEVFVDGEICEHEAIRRWLSATIESEKDELWFQRIYGETVN
jgi:hypothetical protein